jgi:hypothetical protein
VSWRGEVVNAVEIEEAISQLAEQPFRASEFPYSFLEAFGNKATTLKRLRSGTSNKSDLGGVLQRNNIHIAVCATGEVTATLAALESSPATAKAKAKFVLATDGEELQAIDLTSGEPVACRFSDVPDHFGFFLPLAGISTVRQIRDSAFDVRATGRLNRLYVELLKNNPDWDTSDRRPDMNHFMARLIFCFFAEDTDIFDGENLFTGTIVQMSSSDSSNTHDVVSALFRAMNTKHSERERAELPRWATRVPYVNGGLFAGSTDVPVFSKIARAYLVHIGNLDWTKINPDIFGSMIQAVTDEEERGALGLHYTSVPNILKVLNPLFLDDLREQLEAAGGNRTKLKKLRDRLSTIRVFDPACGSGNFLVIAYKQMRAIEADVIERRRDPDLLSRIPLTNFRGIELRGFPAEIARLALIIAEFQCDQLYRGQMEALAEFLPLDATNWITCGNALRMDWLSVCPPTGKAVKYRGDDLFSTPLDQTQIDFENDGGETYVCGNPPYKGGTEQNAEQKADMGTVFDEVTKTWKSLDYISGWFFKFAEFAQHAQASCAFVTTNSICQGEQVARLWPLLFSRGLSISFAHTSFKWANLAANNAGVTVAIVGLGQGGTKSPRIFETGAEGQVISRTVREINAYLIAGRNTVVGARTRRLSELSEMTNGNKPADGGHLVLNSAAREELADSAPEARPFILPYLGSAEFINGKSRFCIWITGEQLDEARRIEAIEERLRRVTEFRASSKKDLTRRGAGTPHLFQQVRQRGDEDLIVMPKVSSEKREYLPVGWLPKGTIVSDLVFVLFDAPLWNLALIASRLHLVWTATVCGKLKTDFRYSNTLGWNTFPVPSLTRKNKADLTRCAEDILLAREAYFPSTIADLYELGKMPESLRAAHERNDEVLERIYVGRRFKNDTERLEKLFDLYTKMIDREPNHPARKKAQA